MALGSGMHEMGHAPHEDGLPEEPLGWPITTAASSASTSPSPASGKTISVIASLSGSLCTKRSSCLVNLPGSDYTLFTLAQRVNLVRPSLIRIQSGRKSYHLHILLRFERSAPDHEASVQGPSGCLE